MKSQDKISWTEKIKLLKKLKHDLKKKKLIIDEERTNFKCEKFEILHRSKNLDEMKGYPCFGESQKILDTYKTQLGIKIIPIEKKFPKDTHPGDLEHLILKKLTEDLVDERITPHIVYFLQHKKVSNSCRALKMLLSDLKSLESEDSIRSKSNVLFSEFVEGNCLHKWVKDLKENDEKITIDEWKYIIFSILCTLFILHDKYKMSHNDVHYGNILIDNSLEKNKEYFEYSSDKIGNGMKFYFPNYGFMPKLWDFEFAMSFDTTLTDLYPNRLITQDYEVKEKNKEWIVDDYHAQNYHEVFKQILLEDKSFDDNGVMCTPLKFNPNYDVHYFLISLLDLNIPDEISEWIINLYPKELIPEEFFYPDSPSYFSESEDESSVSISISEDESESNKDESENVSESVKSLGSDSDNDNNDSDDSTDFSFDDFNEYLYEGRLLNGVDEKFTLPLLKDILTSSFFKDFHNSPNDSELISFNY